jgi:hypothetical protein
MQLLPPDRRFSLHNNPLIVLERRSPAKCTLSVCLTVVKYLLICGP